MWSCRTCLKASVLIACCRRWCCTDCIFFTLPFPFPLPLSSSLSPPPSPDVASRSAQALISAPEATRERAEALWPAMLGLLTALEALAAREVGRQDDPAAAQETCIEALLAAAR